MASREELARWAASPGLKEWEMSQGGTTAGTGLRAPGYTDWRTPAADPFSPYNTGGAPPSPYGEAPAGYYYGNEGELRSNATGQVVAAPTQEMNWNAQPGWAAAYPENTVNGQDWAKAGFQQYDPFAAGTPHPGWNPGEAGPPGSPEYVRNPKTQADWELRYKYFIEDDGGVHQGELDPRWRPINQYYQQKDEGVLARLQAIAAGTIDQWGWTPAMAQKQLEAWGYGQPVAEQSAEQGGGAYGGQGGYPSSGGGTYEQPGQSPDVAQAGDYTPLLGTEPIVYKPLPEAQGAGGGGLPFTNPHRTISSGGGPSGFDEYGAYVPPVYAGFGYPAPITGRATAGAKARKPVRWVGGKR